MHAVPSVVSTGSVVAAAAVGLVFGQPAETTTTPSRPPSRKRKLTLDYGSLKGFPFPSRPSTSATTTNPPTEHPLPPPSPASTTITRPPRLTVSNPAQTTPPKSSSSRRPSFARPRDGVPPIAENARDSLSSNGSWMRRLSLRPLSQHGTPSPRSSLGPDSPSLNNFSLLSHGPPLSPVPSTPPQHTPNKLVKRMPSSTESRKDGTLSRRGSRAKIPTLRRPATSHQRSATLQQVHYPDTPPELPSAPKYSLDQQIRPSQSRPPLLEIPQAKAVSSGWSSFFHSKLVVNEAKASPGRTQGSPQNQLPARSIHVGKGSMPRAYLINAASMMPTTTAPSSPAPVAAAANATPSRPSPRSLAPSSAANGSTASPSMSRSTSPEGTPSKRPKRSISMQFSSPTNWIARAGSLRRQKRGSNPKSGGVRNVSAPVHTTSPIEPQVGCPKQDLTQMFASSPALHNKRDGPPPASAFASSSAMKLDAPTPHACRHTSRQRNSSSPLPPLSRLSSFNLDLYRLGSPSATSPRRTETHMHATQLQASPIPASPSAFPVAAHSRDVSNERASTLAGSDLEIRTFVSGDDDDTEFKSDTMFDSFRTQASARLRNLETPLDSMFDESPPSTSNSRSKRLSIQEILGRSWDGDTRIMEEDEGAPTPIRVTDSPNGKVDFVQDVLCHRTLDFNKRATDISLSSREFGRLSVDDDDDFDWARDDENGLSNHLSPPSSSLNSRGASPNFRTALASISGNGNYDNSDTASERPERPRSNVFDWSEPLIPEKPEVDGHSPRPKTVHGKQELDVRGGRAASRKGPLGGHVRSQSVPVVPDLTEPAKVSNKFRTWASGPKNASEDWEDDFDFDEGPCTPHEGKSTALTFAMVVPESIQATQPTVKAHSGQIRELSLLVNGLKRLCRHGRDLNLWNESAELWKEAENVIKLASPDEEDQDGNGGDEEDHSVACDLSGACDGVMEVGFDSDALSQHEEPVDLADAPISKAAVIRERQAVRRRSVFSPEDDIFGGNWPTNDENKKPSRPETPGNRESGTPDSAMISTVMEAMQRQRRSSSAPVKGWPVKTASGSNSKLFFDTNSLQELVKRANILFHNLSDIVRRAELITPSPATTPKRERHLLRDGSPAFTRVFTDPSAVPPSPPKQHRLPKSHSNSSVRGAGTGGRNSVDSRTSNTTGISQRLQMMTVS